MANEPNQKPPAETPRYQVLEKCYIGDVVHDPDRMPSKRNQDGEDEREPLFVSFDGIPGPHLKPVNAAAKAMCEKHAERMRVYDVIGRLTVAPAQAA